MASLVKIPTNIFPGERLASSFQGRRGNRMLLKKRSASIPMSVSNPLNQSRFSVQKLSISNTLAQRLDEPSTVLPDLKFPILVNGCYGKMGNAIIKSALSAGLPLIPVSFSSSDEGARVVDVCGNEIQIYGPSMRESILASLYAENPEMIVIDYTVPAAVNDNADLYSKIGVPFVMGTTGGDRERMYRTVEESAVYAVISPQMGKQVVAFLAAMEIMAEQFPGAFSGYSLDVMESHQASKLDTSGTAKDIISCFQRLGVSFELDQVQKIRDPKQQVEMVGVPEEYVSGHAFHLYNLTSPDQTVFFEFQHNVLGRSIYADGSIDAAIFLAKKVQLKADKRVYNMIDVLREGNMR